MTDIDRSGIRAIMGGRSCPDRDFSFTTCMMKDKPPRIRPIGCPNDLVCRIDEAGNYVDFYDDVPQVSGDQIKSGRNEPQEVEDAMDTWNDVDKEFSSIMAPHVMKSFETFMMNNPEWVERKTIAQDPLEAIDPNKTFQPYTVRNRSTHAASNPFFNGTAIKDPNKKKPKTVKETRMPSVKVSATKAVMRRLKDGDFYRKRAKLQETKDELKMRKKISAEVIALQVERDRAETELNTLNIMTETEKAYALREHIDQVDQKIDGYNIAYGVEPQALREPSWFENCVRKVRGAVAYVAGKVVDGVKNVINVIGGENAAVGAALPIIGAGLAIGFNLLKIKKRLFG